MHRERVNGEKTDEEKNKASAAQNAKLSKRMKKLKAAGLIDYSLGDVTGNGIGDVEEGDKGKGGKAEEAKAKNKRGKVSTKKSAGGASQEPKRSKRIKRK